jgi:YVTN family beta-propeller protein
MNSLRRSAVCVSIVIGLYADGFAATSSPKFVYVANVSEDLISVVNQATNHVVDLVKVESPFGIAIDSKHKSLYVTDWNSASVTVVNTVTNRAQTTIKVGNAPEGIAVTPDGALVYVGNNDDSTVSVIETATNTVVATIGVANRPIGIAASPNSKEVYVATVSGNSQALVVIDTATNTIVNSIPAPDLPTTPTFSPNGKFVYTADEAEIISVFNTSTQQLVGTIPLNCSICQATESIAFSPTGNLVYIMMSFGEFGVVDTATSHLEHVISFDGTLMFNPVGEAITYDCTDKVDVQKWRAYVASGGSGTSTPAAVAVIDLATNKVIAEIKIGNGVPQGIAATPCD